MEESLKETFFLPLGKGDPILLQGGGKRGEREGFSGRKKENVWLTPRKGGSLLPLGNNRLCLGVSKRGGLD